MVSFRTLMCAAVAVATTPSLAAITPHQTVSNLRTLTTKAQALQAPASSISIVNAALIVIGLGPYPVRLSSPMNIHPALT
jgi:hypothetical protein